MGFSMVLHWWFFFTEPTNMVDFTGMEPRELRGDFRRFHMDLYRMLYRQDHHTVWGMGIQLRTKHEELGDSIFWGMNGQDE